MQEQTSSQTNFGPPAEHVTTTVSQSSNLDALQELHQVQIRSFADVVALARQLQEEQRTLLKELNTLKDDSKAQVAALLQKNNELSEKLALISRIEEEHKSTPGERTVQKIKKPFSPWGF